VAHLRRMLTRAARSQLEAEDGQKPDAAE
jgi:hypothetical protein